MAVQAERPPAPRTGTHGHAKWGHAAIIAPVSAIVRGARRGVGPFGRGALALRILIDGWLHGAWRAGRSERPPGRSLRVDQGVGPWRHGDGVPGEGSPTRPACRGQDPASGTRGAAVGGSLSPRDPGDRADDARAHAETLGAHTSHFHHAAFAIATACAILRDKPHAVSWLQRTAHDGTPASELFANDPTLASLKGTPQFDMVMRRLHHEYEGHRRILSTVP